MNIKLYVICSFTILLLACQPTEENIVLTVENQVAQVVEMTRSAISTATPYPTTTSFATQASLITETPLPTQTLYPTQTPYPTQTLWPTFTPTSTPTPHPTSPPVAAVPAAPITSNQSPLDIQLTVINHIRNFRNLTIEFQGIVGTADHCPRVIEIYNQIANLPSIDVTNANLDTQTAHAAYREGIAHFTAAGEGPTVYKDLCVNNPADIQNLQGSWINLNLKNYTGRSRLITDESFKTIGGE
ncbi:MAG: hypothetical protein KDE51_11605 [Anaerolineales bacterium]|nr:hypothetical protein [Anaerolineales bacterium]